MLRFFFPTADPTVVRKSTEDTDEEEEEPLECNYDTSLTTLYQAIEEKAWIPALDFLEGDEPNKVDQVRTWVTRYEKDGRIRWSQLPIHAAMIFNAPYKVVKALVDLYPKSVKCTDDQMYLPLHLAFKNGAPDNVLFLLLKAFPEAMNVKGFKSRLPLECAKMGPNPIRAEIIAAYVEKTKKECENERQEASKSSPGAEQQVTQLQASLEQESKKVAELESAKAEAEKEIAQVKVELDKAKKELAEAKADPNAEVTATPEASDVPKEEEVKIEANEEAKEVVVEDGKEEVKVEAASVEPQPEAKKGTKKRGLFKFKFGKKK